MSDSDIYRELKRIGSQANAEEKLSILRHELLRPLNFIKGASKILGLIDPYTLTGLPEKVGPEEFEYWRSQLAKAVQEMEDILNALTLD